MSRRLTLAFTVLALSSPISSRAIGQTAEPSPPPASPDTVESRGFPGQPQGYPGQPQGYPGQPQDYPGQPQPYPSQTPASMTPARAPYPSSPPGATASAPRSLLFMGNIGLQHFYGSTGAGLGTGLRIGGLAGAFLLPELSLNGELMLDILNPNSDTYAAQANLTGLRVVVAASPLYHLVNPGIEIVIGPKLGVSATSFSDNVGDSASQHGYILGFNLGAFFKLASMGAGALLTFEDGVPTENCYRTSGYVEQCGSTSNAPSDKVLSLTGALMF